MSRKMYLCGKRPLLDSQKTAEGGFVRFRLFPGDNSQLAS